MRHYDRTGFRHLDDAERYRDYESLADDAWLGPNERLASSASRARGRTAEWEPPSSRPAPAYGPTPPQPSYEGRGPRRAPAGSRTGGGLVSSLRHAGEAVQRAVRALIGAQGTEHGRTLGVDHRIHEDVCERLAHHRDIDATDVVVRVRRGVVTLSGVVATRLMKYLAEDTAADVFGVRDVDNRLKVPVKVA